jgi:hypothetical protein
MNFRYSGAPIHGTGAAISTALLYTSGRNSPDHVHAAPPAKFQKTG